MDLTSSITESRVGVSLLFDDEEIFISPGRKGHSIIRNGISYEHGARGEEYYSPDSKGAETL